MTSRIASQRWYSPNLGQLSIRFKCWIFSATGRRKHTAFKCVMGSLAADSIVSTKNTSFCSSSDWLKTTLMMLTYVHIKIVQTDCNACVREHQRLPRSFNQRRDAPPSNMFCPEIIFRKREFDFLFFRSTFVFIGLKGARKFKAAWSVKTASTSQVERKYVVQIEMIHDRIRKNIKYAEDMKFRQRFN